MMKRTRGFATPVIMIIIAVIMMISMGIFSFMSSGEKRVRQFLYDSIEYAALRKAIAFHYARRKIYPEIGDANYKLAYPTTPGPNTYGINENPAPCNLSRDIAQPDEYYLTGTDPDPPGVDNVSRVQFDITDRKGTVLNRYFLRFYHTTGGKLTPKPLLLECLNVNSLSLTNGPLSDPDVEKLKVEVKRINLERIKNRPMAYIIEREIGKLYTAGPGSNLAGKLIAEGIDANHAAIKTSAGSGTSGLCGTLYLKVAPLADQNLRFRKDTVSVTYDGANTIKDCNKLVAFVCMQQLIQDKLRATMHGGVEHDKTKSAKMLDDINAIGGINKMITIFSALQNFKKDAKVNNSFDSNAFINDLASKGIISDDYVEFQGYVDRKLFDDLGKLNGKNVLLRLQTQGAIGFSDIVAYKSPSDPSPIVVMSGEIDSIFVVRKGTDTTQMPSNFVYSQMGADYDIYMSDIDGISKFPYAYGPENQIRPAVTNFATDNALFFVEGLKKIKFINMESNDLKTANSVQSFSNSVEEVQSICPFKRNSSSSLVYLFNANGYFGFSTSLELGVMLADTAKDGNNRYTHSSHTCYHGGDSALGHGYDKHYYPLAMSVASGKWFFAFTAKNKDSGEMDIYLLKGDNVKKLNGPFFFTTFDREKDIVNLTATVTGNFSGLSKINDTSFIAIKDWNSIVKYTYTGANPPANKFDNLSNWQSTLVLSTISTPIEQACYLKD